MIEYRDVSLTIGDHKILRDINLTLPRNQTTVILGRSGSGKTTLLRLANKLVTPTRGQICVDDQLAADWNPIRLRRSTGYMIQDVGLLPHQTVETNVSLIPRLEQWDKDRISARVTDLLAMLGLPAKTFAKRYPHELSGGQRQRVGIARALAADPPLLLCDEPFASLDPITRCELQIEFRKLTREAGKTVVFVTHDVREALTLADHIVLLQNGSVLLSGSPQSFQSSELPEARAFLKTLDIGDSVASQGTAS